jgi:hypothetical protein
MSNAQSLSNRKRECMTGVNLLLTQTAKFSTVDPSKSEFLLSSNLRSPL